MLLFMKKCGKSARSPTRPHLSAGMKQRGSSTFSSSLFEHMVARLLLQLNLVLRQRQSHNEVGCCLLRFIFRWSMLVVLVWRNIIEGLIWTYLGWYQWLSRRWRYLRFWCLPFFKPICLQFWAKMLLTGNWMVGYFLWRRGHWLQLCQLWRPLFLLRPAYKRRLLQPRNLRNTEPVPQLWWKISDNSEVWSQSSYLQWRRWKGRWMHVVASTNTPLVDWPVWGHRRTFRLCLHWQRFGMPKLLHPWGERWRVIMLWTIANMEEGRVRWSH